jgi:hypothetical protein
MKKYLLKWKAFLLAVIMAITLLPAGTVPVFAAAKPAMSVTNKTVIGIDQEFKLSIKNLTKSKVKSTSWSSTNKKVVVVDGGEVTSVGRGTATVKCKITYKNKNTKTLSCKVTVKIPATEVKITNAQDDLTNNSRQVIAVGDSYDFNCVLTPSNADNYITYSISNKDCASVDSKGIVRGKKPGFVTLTARAKLTKPSDYKNNLDHVLDLKDSINLEIVSKTAKVTDVTLTDTTTLTVTFDKAMDVKSLLNDQKQLLSNIIITTKSDKNGVVAGSLGTLTGSLSSDGKILTIKTTGYFNGLYGIKFTNGILTKDQEPLMEYFKELSLYDKTAPTYKNFTVDDTGLIATINFSEAMDFSGLKIENVQQASSNTAAKSTTINRLSQKTNYKASDDGKSLIIDLTLISTLDYNKQFMVVFSGLKDRAGNYPANDRITTYVGTDTAPKPQAQLISLIRTDGNTLTATFTRSINNPGSVMLSNGMNINGKVKEDNTKQVIYTLDQNSAKLSGKQDVYIGYWDSYNVITNDTSANTYKKVEVNFTIIAEIPELQDFRFDMETHDSGPVYSLILTYNKDVTLLSKSGVFKARLIPSNTGNYQGDSYIGYTAEANGTVVTAVLNSSDMNQAGTFIITLPEDFVSDGYGNTSIEENVKLVSTEGTSTALPKPRAVVQSNDDASTIYVTFGNKLDETTAQNPGNYNVAGATVNNAELTDNTTSGATVKLTLAPNSIRESNKYSVSISGITGYHNTYTAMETYTAMIYLRKNSGPGYVSYKYNYPDVIVLTFSENLSGTASFQAFQNGLDLVENCVISGKNIIITLVDLPAKNIAINVTPTSSNRITDIYGNDIGTLTPIQVIPAY